MSHKHAVGLTRITFCKVSIVDTSIGNQCLFLMEVSCLLLGATFSRLAQSGAGMNLEALIKDKVNDLRDERLLAERTEEERHLSLSDWAGSCS